ncbi:MAG: helix-turn-helix domain-containing protein [Christensenellaceae bacterium]
MDQLKTGKFIAQCRKEKGLTQRQLAERLGISDKAVSKWECGNGLPEVSLMMPLCNIFGISVNELLSGEKLEVSEYKTRAEVNLMELITEKQENKKKIIISCVVCALTIVSAVTLIMVASTCLLLTWIRVALIAVAILEIAGGVVVACLLDQNAGYFECRHCNTRFIPSTKEYVRGLHGVTWRRLKCPHCGKVSNCKKRLTK